MTAACSRPRMSSRWYAGMLVARYGPRLLTVLDTVSARLTTGSLRALNARVELRGHDPRLVAESWLRAQELASAGGRRIEREGGKGNRADWHGEPCAGSRRAADAARRRPTGAPPPLPHPVSVTTTAWLVLGAVVLAGVIVISLRAPSLRIDDQVNTAVLRLFAGPGRRG